MSELYTRVTLLNKVRSTNSETAWVEYVSYYKGYIYALLKGMDVPNHDRDDLLQVILLKCWKYLPEFEYNPNRCKFRSWLTIMVRNTVRDHFKAKSYRSKQLETDIEPLANSLESDDNIEVYAEKEWRIYVAELAWETVSKEFKDTVIEAFVRRANGEKLADIAQKLNIAQSSVSTYETRVRRAIAKEIVRLESFLA
ncbi:RNA polymerase sigma factor [Lentisphaerota bacterium WC36G]|nr:RNA polymerase sigma factor [Lentisphaerae bacterium WC36]